MGTFSSGLIRLLLAPWVLIRHAAVARLPHTTTIPTPDHHTKVVHRAGHIATN